MLAKTLGITFKMNAYVLTVIIFFNYSGHMDADLKTLEKKLTGLIALCTDLRNENAQLRQDLHASKQDASALKANMVEASERIEALMETLP